MAAINGRYYQREVKKALKDLGPAKLPAIKAKLAESKVELDETQILEAIEAMGQQVRHIQTYKLYVLNPF